MLAVLILQFVAPFHARMRWIWIDNLQIRAKQDSLNWLKIFPPLVKDLPWSLRWRHRWYGPIDLHNAEPGWQC
ncbi:hypothetical protein T12_983 [Trichinella patagoniensis]|uniref:Uncharacterized protein n=1 Tax=Trichinella patagoniensis TaxID=990121 RepID=A0A0V1A8T2_9BILA|nr:hypothetical protein T06_16696 [Trichinella sp. T6]KRY21157.1 hypothetical protein T12_983 [Trichinella patagoniensis]